MKKMIKDKKGQQGNPLVRGIVFITLGVIMLANVFIPTVKNTNTSSFTTSELALWGVLTLAGIIGIVFGVFSIFGLA